MPKWDENNIPDQTGRVILITGANSGLGLESTRILANKGGHIIMACRNMKKGEEARQSILQQQPGAKLDLLQLDLGDLASVKEFATIINATYDRLDLLMNNAGLMGIPRSETVDGFEMQFGVNHLGHFALTGQIIEKMLNRPGSRIITLTSTASLYGRIRFDDINLKKSYSRYGSYGQAKLANLLFARELQRRLAASGANTISLAAHPGLVLTELQNRAGHSSGNRLEQFIYRRIARFMAQDISMGILPQLYAATAADVHGGELIGPHRFHSFGYPRVLRGPKSGQDENAARQLWEVSEEMTGITYAFLQRQPAVLA